MTQGGPPDLESLDARIDQLNRIVSLFTEKVNADFGLSLDFQPGSVAYADAILAQAADDRRDLSPGLFLSIGGYVGEVLVRNYDGQWVEDGEDLAVVVEGGAHRRTLHVFDWVHDAYENPHEDNLGQRLEGLVGDGLGSQAQGIA